MVRLLLKVDTCDISQYSVLSFQLLCALRTSVSVLEIFLAIRTQQF